MIFSIASVLAESPGIAHGKQRTVSERRRKTARKPLRIVLNGRSMEFRSIDDFSFAIESRVGVTSSRYHILCEHTPAELRDEAQSIKAVEKTLVDILEDALCDGGPCGEALTSLGLHVFSKDHGWRELMEQLIGLDDRYDAYKRLALIKYMQYLGARQEIIRLVFATKARTRPTIRTVDKITVNPAALETMLFDVSSTGTGGRPADPLQRLPRGEAVKLYALPGHAIEIRLAKHPFRLLNDHGWVLCDPNGRRYALGEAKTLVGRGRENDIRLSADFRYVSRRHLLAEPLDDHVILITDMSSHGTFAPAMQTEQIAV